MARACARAPPWAGPSAASIPITARIPAIGLWVRLRLAAGRRLPLRERALDPVPPNPPVRLVGDGHLLRPANGDGGDQALPELLDRLQVADEHPVGPVEEGHELLGQPPDIFFDREAAAPAPTPPLAGLGEGVLPEELMLDVQRQVADPAVHTESLVITHHGLVHDHLLA